MTVIPFPKPQRYAYLDPKTVAAVCQVWRQPDSSLKKFAPNLDTALRLLDEQARDAKLAAQG